MAEKDVQKPGDKRKQFGAKIDVVTTSGNTHRFWLELDY